MTTLTAPVPLAVPRTGGRPAPAPRRLPAWPVVAMTAGFPVWWVLGLSAFIVPILAVPMLVYLRRRGPWRLPPGFAVWALLLLWTVAGALLLGVTAPGTLPGSASGRLIGYLMRLAHYVAATVLLIYVGNLREDELSRRRLTRLLSVVFLYAVIGGVLGTMFASFEFTSPFEMVLPARINANLYVHYLVHPALAQVQDVLGESAPRPKAPFEYTNSWGGNISVLGTWFLVGWWAYGRGRRRVLAALVVAVAVVPIVYSLNRGLWLGIGISLLFAMARLVGRGRLGVVAGMLAVGVVAGAVVTLSPLHSIITSRLEHGQSNALRSSLSRQVVDVTTHSPIVGYGSTRTSPGSPQSIAVGKTSACPQCGNAPLGSTGQLWYDIIASGFVGAGLYLLFFLQYAWRYRGDTSPIGMAGQLAMLLVAVYGLVYDARCSRASCISNQSVFMLTTDQPSFFAS